MTRIVGLAVVLLVSAVLIDRIGDLTQTRPEPVRRDYATRVVMEVRQRQDVPPIDAVRSLWAACQLQVRRTVVPSGPEAIGDHLFTVTVTPELGATGRQRLTGCLEDTTLDRIKGNVVSMVSVKR